MCVDVCVDVDVCVYVRVCMCVYVYGVCVCMCLYARMYFSLTVCMVKSDLDCKSGAWSGSDSAPVAV